ncbi:hypothetical protein ACQKMN_08815 [Ureibacillus composti]
MRNHHSLYHIYIPIIIGGLIYTLFRVDTLLIFKVYEVLQVDVFIKRLRENTMFWGIPNFVKYSLPDGLWVYAFTYYIASIWKFDESENKAKYIFMSIPLICGLGGELIQLFYQKVGTFDLQDLVISLIAYIAGYIAVKKSKVLCEGEVKYG